MSNPTDQPHRFYKKASLTSDNGGFAVVLDGRPAKTPAGGRLTAPTEALGLILAAEWNAQGDKINFIAMPATRLAFTALDRTPAARDAMAGEIVRVIGAEHLCYFADYPAKLVARQEARWGPWLAWAEREFGLVLIRAKGVSHQIQPFETLQRARALAIRENDFALSGLVFAAGLYGSTVLALATLKGALSGEAALELARLDEEFQEEQWGVDGEAAARTALLRGEAQMLDAWFAALNTPAA